MKKRRIQFLQAVRILAPGDPFILNAAQQVREEFLPAYPGGVALEFVAALERVKSSGSGLLKLRSGSRQDNAGRFGPTDHPGTCDAQETESKGGLALKDALRLKSAEYWLKLGQPVQALMELGRLPHHVQNHPWALKVQVAAVGAAREMGEMMVQA